MVVPHGSWFVVVPHVCGHDSCFVVVPHAAWHTTTWLGLMTEDTPSHDHHVLDPAEGKHAIHLISLLATYH